jgi:hypothetical protein
MSRNLALSLLLLCSTLAWSQVNGSITGTVADATGSAVAVRP